MSIIYTAYELKTTRFPELITQTPQTAQISHSPKRSLCIPWLYKGGYTLPFSTTQSSSLHQRHDHHESAPVNLQDFPFIITTVKRMKAAQQPLNRKGH